MCASPFGDRNPTETGGGSVASPRCSARNASATTVRAAAASTRERISVSFRISTGSTSGARTDDNASVFGMSTTDVVPGAVRTLELLGRQVGRPLSEIETPAAVVDLDRLETNLQELQSYADEHSIALWPHTKTHKSPEIGLRQLELGARGLTVAKTGEAEVFAEAGAPAILFHYPPFGADKWERLADIAASGVAVTVAVDSLPPAEGLASRLARRGAKAEVLVELDVGLHRTGQTTTAGALELAQRLSGVQGLDVAGISCYPGHCRPEDPELRTRLDEVDAFLRETRDAFLAAGIRCDRISGGATPTRFFTHETCVNELRSGTYALLDRNDGPDDRCALWIEVTVVSDAVPNQIVVDAGSKTFTSDDHPDGGH